MSDTTSPSAVFAFADEVVDRLAKSDPLFATEAGIPGYERLLPDFSAAQQRRDQAETLRDLQALELLDSVSDVDRIAKEVLRERLSVRLALLEADEYRRTFSVLNSPVSAIRQVFELMATTTADDATHVAARLKAVRASLDTWRGALLVTAAEHELPAVRHVLGIADQADTHAAGAFSELAQRVAAATSVDVGASGLANAAKDAEAAYAELAMFLRSDIAPKASTHEACGEERYQRWSAYWSGATLDLRELYVWGYQDLRRINSRMWEIANELLPGASSLVAVADLLDNDPKRTINGTDTLLTMLKDFTQRTANEMDGVHFDIDDRIRFCDARLAPEGSSAAPYYINPSEDLSRPGTTWFPTMGKTTFSWWRHASTWYHESIPGHHLQIATALLAADQQSRYHRLVGATSGYVEGWALYAERLMDELGYFSDLGDELGYLSNQALRAARIVVDIGLHLELDAPSDLGVLGDLGDCSGKQWTPAMAVALLDEWAIQDHVMSTSEVDRYLGLPAQAISYKVGERMWLAAREEAKQRLGDRFSLKAFHAHALVLGPLAVETFMTEMAAWDGGN
ncbi:MAG TPA: DUF885 domain-containing protein [Acidimicrobiales bacterium]